MYAHLVIETGLLDRPGCGDELYEDSRYRAAARLEDLRGTGLYGRGIDLDLIDEDADEPTDH
jgi:hypothetical protein